MDGLMDGWMRKEGRNKFNYVLLGFCGCFCEGWWGMDMDMMVRMSCSRGPLQYYTAVL